MARSADHKSNTGMNIEGAFAAVVTVGAGRGFIVGMGRQRFVITAAHCLPEPPPPGNVFTEERTYPHLLAPLNSPPSILAECVFVDPVADLAVLVSPDNQIFFDKAFAFDDLVDSVPALNIAAAKNGEAWMLSLEGVWAPCVLRVPAAAHWMASIHVENFLPGIAAGMSGSPIISPTGEAVGAICNARVTWPSDLDKPLKGYNNPNLIEALPARLLNLMYCAVN